MLSRVADSCFWLSRYIERAESSSRILDVNMQLVLWSVIDSVECEENLRRLLIHYTAEKSAGVMVSLSPILPAQRELLRALVASLASQRASASPTL